MDSVWTRKPRPQKAPGLDRAQIVREAMALLDAEGLNALTMRRLGARLNAGATSLYWYVSTKDDLLELVLDEVYGEFLAYVTPDDGWRKVALGVAYAMRASLIRHTWAIPMIGSRPAIGPQAIRLTTRMNTTFDRAGFQGTDVEFAAATLLSYVLGALAPEAAWKAMTDRAGGDPKTVYETIRPMVAEAAADHPELLARYDEFNREDPTVLRAVAFDFGLSCVLDGLTARLAEKPGRRPWAPGAGQGPPAADQATPAGSL
jgi:AcrR family transcriptional regulator